MSSPAATSMPGNLWWVGFEQPELDKGFWANFHWRGLQLPVRLRFWLSYSFILLMSFNDRVNDRLLPFAFQTCGNLLVVKFIRNGLIRFTWLVKLDDFSDNQMFFWVNYKLPIKVCKPVRRVSTSFWSFAISGLPIANSKVSQCKSVGI